MTLFGGSDESLQIVIKARDDASKVMKKVEKSATDFRSKIDSLKPAFQKMAVIGTASFAAIAAGATKAINKARDFEEETNKFNVVFRDVSEEADKMAKHLNDAYGLSLLKSKQLLSGTGDLLSGFGFTGKAALDLSSQVQTLAVDLASFTNAQGGAEAVSAALSKALLGERESLKTYGIAIMEADIQAELLARGMDELTGEALRQAKAQITLDLAMRQSKNAIGDYARSTGSLKQTQVELAKTIEDVQVAIGEQLAPILNDILKKLQPVIDRVLEWIEANPELTKNIIIGAAALSALVAVLGALGLVLPVIIGGFTIMTGTVGLVIAIIVALGIAVWNIVKIVDTFANHWDEVWAGVKIIFFEAWDAIKEKISSVVDFIKEQIDKVIDLYNKMKTIVTTPIKNIGGAIGGAFSRFGSSVSNALGFEHGGTVPGPVGKAVPIIAHGQEQIIPASQTSRGSGGNVINVTFNNPVVRDRSDIDLLRREMESFFNGVKLNHKISV